MKAKIAATLLLLVASIGANAQNEHWRQNMEKRQQRRDSLAVVNRAEGDFARLAFSTNAVEWAWFGTANAAVQYSVNRRFTLTGKARYNGWTYRSGQIDQFETREQTYGLGVRFWPWYTYSGWWFEGRALFSQYNQGGLRLLGSQMYLMNGYVTAEEGYRVGPSLGVGYSIQVNSWLDIDVGLYGWAGRRWYKTYSCTNCGERIDPNALTGGFYAPYSRGWFIRPDEAMISLMFIF